MVMHMMQNIRDNLHDIEDDEELEAYLKKLLHGEAFDRKGLIYGMGHAVYSLSDPREVVFKGYVEQLAHEKGRDKDLSLYTRIERMAPQLIAQERKIFKGVSPNVDFYSGFVYEMLGIPMELYTPLFAVATQRQQDHPPGLQEPWRHPRLYPAQPAGIKGGHQHGRVAAASGGMVLPPRA